jgi:hypothetical protein
MFSTKNRHHWNFSQKKKLLFSSQIGALSFLLASALKWVEWKGGGHSSKYKGSNLKRFSTAAFAAH